MRKKSGFFEFQGFVHAIITGLLLTSAFPKVGLWWMGWVALVPLFFALKKARGGHGFQIGFLAGLVHYLSLMYWLVYTMRIYGGLPIYLAVPVLFLLASYMALYLGAFSLLMTSLVGKPWHCLLATPVLWVGLEYVRGFFLTGFPWAFLGHSQISRLELIQISDLIGAYGVSALMVMASAAVYLLLTVVFGSRQRNDQITMKAAMASIGFVGILVALTWIYGAWKIQFYDFKTEAVSQKKVTVVQGNIDQAIKWNPSFQKETTEKYIRLSLSAKEDSPDLIVWPETATPFYLILEKELTEKVLSGIRETGSDFLIGSPSIKKTPTGFVNYNSAYLVNSEGKIAGKYDKVHLVPFGEYVPLEKWLPFIGKMVAQVGDFRSGKKGDTLKWENQRLGMLICFEIIFPSLSRAMVKNGATVLVNITNDAWFGTTSAPYQHLSMAVFRAVENRRYLVRAANTGISCFIDPAGRMIDPTGLYQDAVKTQNVSFLQATSFYTRHGDWFAQACMVISFLFVIFNLVRYLMGKGKP